MSEPDQPAFDRSDAIADLLLNLFERADKVLVKKLSKNDRDWARFPNKHQAGPYIPHEQRDGGFFPPLELKAREAGAAEIREVFFSTVWPQLGGEKQNSRLVHYSSKGQETHLTRLPNAAFGDLLPASFLVMGRLGRNASAYECLTIDSGAEESILLAELFNIGADFLIGEFSPAECRAEERGKILDYAGEVVEAWLRGTIASFAARNASMPPTIEMARLAQNAFLDKYGVASVNPFALENPGDALREISRTIEWDLFREHQHKRRSVELVRRVLGDAPCEITASDMIHRLVDGWHEIDALMLSASQQRKSRAGSSYEHHIEAMLTAGGIPFEKQVIIESRKRPDFILPSLAFVDSGKNGAETGLILSAKTTLRERWKQVEREKGRRRLFLTTVDENIASNAIEEMASIGVYLVIPESLRQAKETEYAGHENVMSFKQFCVDVVRPNLETWTRLQADFAN